ncbi:formate dehydrogenase subunit alpha [Acetobacterium woodii]|uniref:Formate dehydrogenase H n=1 Tax=Acetobacterium woodii (strain ATCC 29683 / DSM 1030 / JCM 2381 / KCTC 1655 / WB1) TaxID=931626 RepID=H6LB59_ACEWD|nr:formate dehydrogenase subunit alpha [Acetobacterium woodii]AFA47611.1 formate dehydrogenase H [Acetobacterium woodii DSM 1030]
MKKKVLTTCPYCGSGCQLYLNVEDGKIVSATPADGRTNQETLCLKGHYGWDYLNDPQILTKRLTKPQIRKNGKLEDVEWDEAISYTAQRLSEIKTKYGSDSIIGTGCARGSGNEANYVMQKFMRAVIGTNNVDHCARVCHAPSVSGLAYSLGSGAMSLSIPEIEDAKLLLIFGYNPAESHPIVARRIIKAKQKGAKIIVVDPRITESARIADLHLQIKGGSNLALVQAMANVIILEGLVDHPFIEDHTSGYEEYKKQIEKYPPEYAQSICHIPADTIRQAARQYAKADSAAILWGMGVTQFGQAVDVVKGLASLALLTGNFGGPSMGVGPVRGQNNVQGGCDMGALPNCYPGYQDVTDDIIREKFEKAWGVRLSKKNGIPLTQVPQYVLHEKDEKKKIRAYYIFGEDPGQSDPDLNDMRKALDALEFVVVQDIYMNKTGLKADVILPATAWGEHEGVCTCADRGFQRIRKAVEPKGDLKPDWEIISLVSTAMGYPMSYKNTKEIWDEMRSLSPLFFGATYEKIEKMGGVLWPCKDESMADKGTMYLHKDGVFAHLDGKGKFFATEWRAPGEIESKEYPFSLSTVREVGHYSVRTMTGNCRTLSNLEDEPGWIQMSLFDCEKLKVKEGDLIRVSSKRGTTITRVKPTERVKAGATYMTYQWWVGACNDLTVPYLDPVSNTPESKYCAIKLEKIDDQVWAEKYIRESYQNIRRDMGIDIVEKEYRL